MGEEEPSLAFLIFFLSNAFLFKRLSALALPNSCSLIFSWHHYKYYILSAHQTASPHRLGRMFTFAYYKLSFARLK